MSGDFAMSFGESGAQYEWVWRIWDWERSKCCGAEVKRWHFKDYPGRAECMKCGAELETELAPKK